MPSDKEENFINKICISIRFALILPHLRADTLDSFVRIKVAGRGWHYGKAFTWRFGFDTLRTSQLPSIDQKQSNSRCHGICPLYPVAILCRKEMDSGYGSLVIYIHIGVRSALLVSINRVMRRPLECETSNRYRFSRFFVLNNVRSILPNQENL